MAQIFSSPFAQYTDASGNPGSGDKLYFYQTGTTTLLTIYSDIGLTTPQANPVIADSAGQWPAVYLAEQLYKVVMKSAADVTIRTADPAGGNDVTGGTSSTDNAVARWDNTSGRKLQNSGVVIDDTNNVSGIAGLTITGNLTAAAMLGAARPPTFREFTADGTWTKPAGCVRAVFEGCGGGGGSGGINGAAGASGVTAGGASGFYGKTGFLDVSAVVSTAVTIGAAGSAGNPTTNGGNGGNTSITIGATTYTWGGGTGSDFRNSSSGTIFSMEGLPGGTGTNVVGWSMPGGMAVGSHTDLNLTSGAGGSSGFGTGGAAIHRFSGGAIQGNAGTGFGSGAGGSVAANQGANVDVNGRAGQPGYMRIWEYY